MDVFHVINVKIKIYRPSNILMILHAIRSKAKAAYLRQALLLGALTSCRTCATAAIRTVCCSPRANETECPSASS
jgi:hypothetical protein